ncbi:hypothetical protein QYE76_033889 [Lolium multiflorum]|uniref:Uncharacterized protein n=1 Tax=Lolium multiflorum TaxID=4521 RepID=A0AAD8QWK9_LOLMU|nr:hypothetical protein QYE76_033889 [Lolium multiflorum]
MASTVPTLTYQQVEELCASNYPCPPGYRVPAGWSLSAGGVPVPPVPQGTALRAAITNHYYLDLTPEQRMNPRWHPDNQQTWDAFFINRPSSCISNGPTKIISGLITCLFFTFPTFSILHESITEMIRIVFIDDIIPFFIFFHSNPSFSMLGPTIIAWHETVSKQVHVNIS